MKARDNQIIELTEHHSTAVEATSQEVTSDLWGFPHERLVISGE